MYLEKWEPWYLRWLSFLPSDASIYGRLATDIAEKNRLLEDGRLSLFRLYERRGELNVRLERVKLEKEKLHEGITMTQEKLRTALRLRWPNIEYPYTNGYRVFVNEHLSEALDFITNQTDYATLVSRQERYEELEHQILTLRREATQLDKILRLRKLARLTMLFERFATGREKEEYRRLVACEKLAF